MFGQTVSEFSLEAILSSRYSEGPKDDASLMHVHIVSKPLRNLNNTVGRAGLHKRRSPAM